LLPTVTPCSCAPRRREDFVGAPLLVMFLSNECPFVKYTLAEITRIGYD
jgi:hypothetical protein